MSLGDNALYLLISKFSEPPREPPLDLVLSAIMECPRCVHYKIVHKHHSTPLHWAARLGFSSLVRVLLQNGALPNCEDDEGKTPLHYAAEGSGDPCTAAHLLCRGAHVDAVSATSDTPLHLAAMMGSSGIAAVLLMRGADPRKSCSDSFCPLHVAAFHGHGVVVALLCMYGASVTDITSDSYTPVDLARFQVRRPFSFLFLTCHLASLIPFVFFFRGTWMSLRQPCAMMAAKRALPSVRG